MNQMPPAACPQSVCTVVSVSMATAGSFTFAVEPIAWRVFAAILCLFVNRLVGF